MTTTAHSSAAPGDNLRFRAFIWSGSIVALALALATPAVAQTADMQQTDPQADAVAPAPVGQAQAAGNNQEIVVTGSRIARRDNVADSPIVTVSAATLQNSSTTSLEASLNELPQFTPAQTRFASGSDSAAQATVNLRALGDSRTLVLIDGRRPQPSNSRVTFDLNTLPTSIIDNVEVITGGASAVYGSDAIAGVVNIITKKNFEGLQLDGRTSITERGDGAEYQLGALIGGNFADDRGHAMIAFDYTKREPIYQNRREFYDASYRGGTGFLASPYLPDGYYVPAFDNAPDPAVINGIFAGYGTPGAIPNVGVNFGFNNNGTLFTTGLGGLNYQGSLFPQYAITPVGNLVYNSGYPQLLTAPMDSYTVYGSASYDVTDAITVYGSFNYADYTTTTNTAAAPADGLWTINVPRDAAHPVPADLAAILDSRPDPTAPFQIGKRLNNVGDIVVDHTNQVYQVTLGARGDLGVGNLKWDVYGSHGKSTLADNYVGGAVVYQRLLDLVALPNYGAGATINGITCTSGVLLFGTTPLSEDCTRALTAQLKRSTEVTQDIAEATLSGSVATLPAGDIGFAVGATYRKNKYAFTPDALVANSQSNAVVGVFGSEPTEGSTNVKEFYGELLVPILKDSAIADSLDVDLAYRYSDYNTAGGVHTYKASANWAVRDFLRLRGGYQRAIRAPNVAELYSGRSLAIGLWPDSDPCSNTSTVAYGNNASNPNRQQARNLCVALGVPATAIDTYTYFTPIILGEPVGNPDVQEEKADTYTLGAVLSPKINSEVIRNLSLSVDFYQINVKDAIGLLPAADIYARCFNATGENPNYDASSIYCAAIGRDDGSTTVTGIATGIPTTTEQPFLNLGGFKTRGIDIVFNTGFNLGNDMGLNLNVVANHLMDFKIQNAPDQPFQDFAGTIGNTTTGNGTLPKWQTSSTLTGTWGPTALGVRWRWVDSMRYYTNVSIPGDTTPGTKAYSNFDLFGSVDVSRAYTIRFGVDNLTDKQPLVVGGTPGSTDPTVYDPIGRRYYMSVRAKF